LHVTLRRQQNSLRKTSEISTLLIITDDQIVWLGSCMVIRSII
jgi:hypothetical protein